MLFTLSKTERKKGLHMKLKHLHVNMYSFSRLSTKMKKTVTQKSCSLYYFTEAVVLDQKVLFLLVPYPIRVEIPKDLCYLDFGCMGQKSNFKQLRQKENLKTGKIQGSFKLSSQRDRIDVSGAQGRLSTRSEMCNCIQHSLEQCFLGVWYFLLIHLCLSYRQGVVWSCFIISQTSSPF